MARILIVDDEQTFTAIMCRRLTSMGHEVEEVWTTQEAEERISSASYDLVLLDFSMPGMRGDEWCRKLREHDEFKHIPVIVVTAFQNRDVQFFMDAGANDVIYKPVDHDELGEKIAKVLSAKPKGQ